MHWAKAVVYCVVRSLLQWALVLSELRETQQPAHAVLNSLIIPKHVALHFGNSLRKKKKAHQLEPQAPLCPLLVALAVSEAEARR